MIYLQIIWEAIKTNAVGWAIGFVGLIAVLMMFIPKDSKLYKIINWFKK
tara:strand:+ start:372 stop:518 length:147 start_codon:yes stop_codon:yes gene_type:complete